MPPKEVDAIATELATAYVSLSTSARGLRGDVDQALGAATGGAEKQGKTMGGKLSSGFSKVAKVGFAGALGVAGTALAKGFGRLKGIDDAQGKLKGLGHSTKTVDGIMKNALGSVKGTAFGLDEAATTAAGAVAAGIKPGKALQDNLTLVADAASIAGTDMGSMGAIFNKVASTNKIQGDVLAQLGDQGIPILQFLSKEMGVSAEEVSKLASKGEIDFATFSRAMEDGLGGAAQASGDTFSGAMKNTGAALGRLGASVLSGIFPQMKDGFGSITATLDRLGPAAEKVGQAIGTGLSKAVQVLKDLHQSAKDAGVYTALGAAIKAAFGFIKDVAVPAISALIGWMRDNKETVLAFVGVLAGFAVVSGIVSGVVALGAAIASPIVLIAALAAGLVWLYKNNETARAIMQAAWAGIKAAVMGAVEWIVTTGWPALKTAFTAVATVATWLWKSVLAPVFTGIWQAAKVAFGYFQTSILPIVKAAFQTIAGVISGALTILKGVFNVFKGLLTGDWRTMWSGLTGIVSGAWKVITSVVSGAVRVVGAVLRAAWTGVRAATVAAWALIRGAVTAAINVVKAAVTAGARLVLNVMRSTSGLTLAAVRGAWNAIKGAVTTNVNAVKSVVGATWSWVKSQTSNAWNGVKTFVRNGVNGAKVAVSAAVAGIKSAVSGAWNTVKSSTSAAWNNFKSLVRGGIDGAKSSVTSGISNIVSTVQGIPGRVQSALGNLGNTLKNAGRDLIQGLINGITEKLGSLQSKLNEVTNKIPDWKGPPPKDKVLLKPAGETIMGGLIGGLDSQVPALKSFLSGVTSDIAGTPLHASQPRKPSSVAGQRVAAGSVSRMRAAPSSVGSGGEQFVRLHPADAALLTRTADRPVRLDVDGRQMYAVQRRVEKSRRGR